MAAPQDVPFACRCGQLHGQILSVAPNRGNRLTCYCSSCQTAASVLGDGAALDAHGGTDVFQTVPSRVQITAGAEHLACLRLSPKGLLRFYASCCDAPLFTMPNQPRFALAGLNMGRIADADKAQFGPTTGAYSTKGAIDPPTGLRDHGLARAGLGASARALAALLRRDSWAPFFDAQGQIAPPLRVLTLEERRAHTPKPVPKAT